MKAEYLDYFCLIVLVFNALLGFWRGLINEIFRIAAVVGAVAAVYLFNEQSAIYLTLKFGYSFFFWKLLTSIFLYTITYSILIYTGKLLTGLIKISMLSPMNRAAGSAFGALKAALILFAVFFLLNSIKGFGQKASNSTAQQSFNIIKQKYDIPDISDGLAIAEKLNALSSIYETAADTDTRNDTEFPDADLMTAFNNNESVKKILENEETRNYLKSGKWNKLFADRNFIDILLDKNARSQLLGTSRHSVTFPSE